MSDFKKYLNVYEFECVLPGSNKKVVFKPFTTGQIKKLLTYEKEQDEEVIEKAIDDLVTSSIISEKFDIKELYIQDRVFLLVELRKATKGTKFEFENVCEKCKSQTIHIIDLNKLIVKPFKKDISNRIKINEKLSIDVELIKRKHQIKASEAFKVINEKKLTDMEKLAELTLFTHAVAITAIITPEGENKETTIADRKELLEGIPTSAYDTINSWYEDNDFGVKFKVSLQCAHCDKKIDLDIPMNNFFF